jgi:WD40 repeat protein
MALHMQKQNVASAMMTVEEHKNWIAGVDFHPAGSHLVICGSDSSLKLWDFLSSGKAHTFQNISLESLWRAKFHDTGDYVLQVHLMGQSNF